MVKALLHTYSMDVVALPIHDCLITREKDVHFAKSAMELASKQVVGYALPVEVKASGHKAVMEEVHSQEEDVVAA
jgi:hypothetical protein